MSLSEEAADFVDRQLAPFARTLTRIKNLLAVAILRFDPERAAAEEAAAADNRGIWCDHERGGDALVGEDSRPNGTGRMETVADVPDLLALKDALEQKVREQLILGATEPENVLMTKGLGILADPQYALDISATAELIIEEQTDQAYAPESSPPACGSRSPRW
jgi:hypothetical protein